MISNNSDDFMEFGTLISLKDGWFLDQETNTRFRLDENGSPVNEHGEHLSPNDLYGDDEER